MTTVTSAKPTLLVVDDDSFIVGALQRIFEGGYTVCSATSGDEALQWCAHQVPDLILLDVMMPGMTGHEVCHALKANATTRDIPVIFVTGQNEPAQESAALQLGAVDFISKPFNAMVVRARVSAQLVLRQTLRQLQDLNDNLEARVAQRTSELQQALAHLQESQTNLAHSEAKATLSTMIAGVSHELGTPLGNSKIVAGTLTEQMRTTEKLVQLGELKRSGLIHFMAQVSEGLALLQNNLDRAFELLGDFRQVAADQASEQRRGFNLAEVVGEILNAMSPTLKRHAHQVVVDIPAAITMDSLPGPLGQVVINLVNNAYLHAFEGRTDGVLTICAAVDREQVNMQVSDNGVGMDAEHLKGLFVPFFSTKIGRGGTGLGMAIVNNLVTKTLGGRIAVVSTVGKGTCFDLVLPRVLPTPTPSCEQKPD